MSVRALTIDVIVYPKVKKNPQQLIRHQMTTSWLWGPIIQAKGANQPGNEKARGWISQGRKSQGMKKPGSELWLFSLVFG